MYRELQRTEIGRGQVIVLDAGVRSNADVERSRPHYPAGGALFCQEPTLLSVMVMGDRPHSDHRATLPSILST